VPGTGTTTTRYVSHEATIRAWLRRALAEVVTSAPADILRLASYTVRPSPSGDNGLSAGRSKHTANGAEPQFHVLVVNQSITSCGAVMTWRSVPGGSAPGSSSGSRLPDNLAAIGTNPNYGPSYPRQSVPESRCRWE